MSGDVMVPAGTLVGWPLWRRQLAGVLRLELRKTLLSSRSLMLYALAAMPVLLGGMHLLATPFMPEGMASNLGRHARIFTGMYSTFILRFVIFLTCLWMFMNLFRGELIDRSLHYYLLTPIRRWLLVTGKFLAAWVSASVMLSSSTVLALLLMVLPAGPRELADFFINGPGVGQVVAYVVTTVLACLGYGALFLAIGLLTKNPIIPGVIIWGWESINYFLPATLKKISVIHYLQALAPMPPQDGPFVILVEPVSPWIAVPGLLIVTAALLVLATWRAQRLEIVYGTD
ncbi:MAG: hypothetical protein JSV80_17080 [Acidobacteriota bacterium]|nr:MAG: hypothetical protein JSV80_17080 [Acidobacteriota bacterium]